MTALRIESWLRLVPGRQTFNLETEVKLLKLDLS
jgi:hypothetical protein